MTGSKVLLPLRVPELGPSLGKLVTGSGKSQWLPLDPIRYQLVTRIFESAGEARQLAAKDDRAAAVSAVGRARWLDAWDEAVSDVTDLLVNHVTHHLRAEARAVRMPNRRLARVGVDDAARRALAVRLGSAGANLVAALDDLDSHARRAEKATGLEPNAVEEWQYLLTVSARRLEEAWLRLEDSVERETERWREVADHVAAWRRPVWPVLVLGVAVLAVAAWLGLVFGGYVDPPDWMAAAWRQVPRP